MRRALSKSLFIVVAVLLAPFAVADDAELASVRAKIDAMFDEISPENVTTSPVDGWYTVQKGSIVAYVSGDGRYLLQGDLIDLDMQTNLSEKARNDSRRAVMADVAEKEFITFTPDDKKYSITVFTDITCTYCRKLHNEIEDYMEQGIEVRYLLYPRNGPASMAWSRSEDVWCARDRNGALTAAKRDQGFATNKCDASAISEHYILGQNVGLTGTPAMVFDDGSMVSGYLPAAELASRLMLMQESAVAAE